MLHHERRPGALRYVRSGALAGVVSTVVFIVVHGLLISNIWFSAGPMIVAGALCGASVAWTYALLIEHRTLGSWVRYNAVYFAMFVSLGLTSVVVFDPVTTIAALLQANEPPRELFARAMPMTALFLVASTVALSLLYGRQWRRIAAILLTCTVLIALLGLNVSAIGLVAVPRGSLHLILELFALIFLLDAVFVAAFTGLEWRTLTGHAETGLATAVPRAGAR